MEVEGLVVERTLLVYLFFCRVWFAVSVCGVVSSSGAGFMFVVTITEGGTV